MKAIIFARVSSKDQEEGHSAQQEMVCPTGFEPVTLNLEG